MFVASGAVASAAIGLATDFLKKKAEEEKSLYSAQYSDGLVDDSFWEYSKEIENKSEPCTTKSGKDGMSEVIYIKHILKPNYIGFSFERKINVNITASVAYFGFKTSSDKNFFQIRPLSYHLEYAKAKVLSNEKRTWVLPHTLLMKLFKISNNSVDILFDVNMEAYWTEKGKDYTGPKPIASFKVNIAGYNMDDRPILDADKFKTGAGWLFSPRLSDDIYFKDDMNDETKAVYAGNFKLTVTATERDTSEATKLLETTEELVSKGGDKLNKIVEE